MDKIKSLWQIKKTPGMCHILCTSDFKITWSFVDLYKSLSNISIIYCIFFSSPRRNIGSSGHLPYPSFGGTKMGATCSSKRSDLPLHSRTSSGWHGCLNNRRLPASRRAAQVCGWWRSHLTIWEVRVSTDCQQHGRGGGQPLGGCHHHVIQ